MALTKPKIFSLPQDRGPVDKSILWLVILLSAVGLMMLFSASMYVGQVKYDDGYFYVKQQMRGLVVGYILMFLLSRVDYRIFGQKIWTRTIFIACVVLLLLCFVPGIGLTEGLNGAKRWLRYPISFQPSEITKFGMIIVLAGMIARYRKGRINSFLKGVVPLLVPVAVIAVILLLQPNYSILVLTVVSCFAVIFMGGMKKSQVLTIIIVGIAAGFVLMMSAGYRANRVKVFLDPFADADNGYQLRQSLYAIGSGGFFGRGLGQSKQKYLFLPYRESDFIFSIIAEEFGFVGCVALLLLYFVLIWRSLRVAWKCPDQFGRLTVAGITVVIGLQTLMNIAVATGSMPPTGVPLPFFSYGSSSLACFLAAAGVLLGVSRTTTPMSVRVKKSAPAKRQTEPAPVKGAAPAHQATFVKKEPIHAELPRNR